MEFEERPPIIGRILKILAIVIVLVAVGLFVLISIKTKTTSMRIISITGSVLVQDTEGTAVHIGSDSVILSGYTVSSGASGSASVALDTNKTVTIDENTRAVFRRTDEIISVDLDLGGLFFEASKPLMMGESFTINTGTLTMHLSSASGYLQTLEDGTTSLTVTSGEVDVIDRSSNYAVAVTAGQKVTINLTSGTLEDCILERVTENDLNDFVLAYLLDRWELRDTICFQTGWDNETLIILAGGTPETEETYASETEETESSTPTPTPRPTSTPRPSPTPEPEVLVEPAAQVVPEVIPETPAEPEVAPETPAETEAQQTEATEATEAPEQTQAPEQTEPAPEPEQQNEAA